LPGPDSPWREWCQCSSRAGRSEASDLSGWISRSLWRSCPANQTTGFVYTPPPGTTTVSLTVQQVVQGGSSQVNLVLVDGCGECRTFVGGGADAFH